MEKGGTGYDRGEGGTRGKHGTRERDKAGGRRGNSSAGPLTTTGKSTCLNDYVQQKAADRDEMGQKGTGKRLRMRAEEENPVGGRGAGPSASLIAGRPPMRKSEEEGEGQPETTTALQGYMRPRRPGVRRGDKRGEGGEATPEAGRPGAESCPPLVLHDEASSELLSHAWGDRALFANDTLADKRRRHLIDHECLLIRPVATLAPQT